MLSAVKVGVPPVGAQDSQSCAVFVVWCLGERTYLSCLAGDLH